jgi:DNA-binding MarR family transcriptional regulator
VELTPQGRALITQAFRQHAEAMETTARILPEKERKELLSLLRKLGPAPRMYSATQP